jgi:uncharacterized repeat protein (TIGR01451 family)
MKLKPYPTLWLVTAILACVALFVITPAPQPVRAAGPWYVASGGSDANTCTAPGAACATINGALNKPGFVAGDTIRVATGTYTGAGDQVVLLDKSATLSGGWNASFATQVDTSTIDAQEARRGIMVNSGVTATVERFAIRNARASGAAGYGADGIYNSSGTLTLNASVVSDYGNGSDNGDGIYNDRGTLTLNNSIVTNGKARYSRGITNTDNAMTLNNSTVSNNNGPGIVNWGTAILNSSTVSGNTGGGIQNLGGALALNNSTVTGNSSNIGGGILNNNSGTVTLNSSTVSGNKAVMDNIRPHGGGIYNSSGVMTLANSIVGNNTTGFSGPDCGGVISSAGYNLIGNTTNCTFSPTTGDRTNVDPKLGPLEGSPAYYPLPPDSPAVNSGDPAGCKDDKGNPLPADQRGLPRFGRCDMGAYELQPFGFSAITANRSGAFPGDALTYTIALTNAGATGITGVQVSNALPATLSYIDNSLTASSGSAGYQNGVVTWTGMVSAGGIVAITYRAAVGPTLGFILNSAVITGSGESMTRTATVIVDGAICDLTKHAGNPVLATGASGSWDDEAAWGPVVLKEGNSYKMWYTGSDGANPSKIGLATSTDGINWTKSSANPVLSPDASWDESGVRAGAVIFDDGLYKMWYTMVTGTRTQIGYATSPDGITWNKYGPNGFALSVGAYGSWEDEGVSDPIVIKEGGAYHLWYTGNDGATLRIGHATSYGIVWTKDPANPVLDLGSPGAWDWLHVYGPSVVKVGAEYKLWYSGETLPAAWQTGYATSSDGSTWTRGKMLIPEGASGAFDAASADYPSVMVDGDKYKVWYSGLNNSGDYTIGYATAEICSTASVPPSHPIYLPLVVKNAGQSCPAYYTDNFSDPTSGWPVDDDSNRRYVYTDGQYQIWVKNPAAGWWATPGAKATDFTASVSARRTSGVSGAYGIRFGIKDDNGSGSFYEFIVEDTYFSIFKYGEWAWTALQDWTVSSHIHTGTDWNRLKVIRSGASIAVYANDQLLTTVSDSDFTGLRRIGLVAYSPDNSGLDARFDDFSLYPASCGSGAASATGVGFEMGEPGGYEAPVPPGLSQLRQVLP